MIGHTRIEARYRKRVSYNCITCYLDFNSHLKQLYISNKIKHFSFNRGCVVCGHHAY